MKESYYITTPIYYVNALPHIGHAYTTLACDVLARFNRLLGKEVFFLTGTDEHGQKIEKSAKKQEIPPKDFVDSLVTTFKELIKIMDCSPDDFIRTTERRHTSFVEKIWTKLLDSGQIYLAKYSGWYAVKDEAFYKENDLVDGKAPTGAEVEWIEEESYFFKLSAWQESLLQFYETNPDFILPESRKNEVISFVKRGLHDLSISRCSFSWGIKVPHDEKHIIYVWLDALFNYLSALQDISISEDSEKSINCASSSTFWPCNIHIIGKDILIFHAVYWPAFLMALKISPPKAIFAHGWWLNEGQKISKSAGNILDPFMLVDEFGTDYVRYFLMREIPFGNDGSYSREALVQRVNSELANNIGNLSQRTFSFIWKNCDGLIEQRAITNEADHELLVHGYAALAKITKALDKQAIQQGLGIIVEFASLANSYIDHQAPWALKKHQELERMRTVLYVLAESIRIIGILLQPFIPQSANKILANFTNLEDMKLTEGKVVSNELYKDIAIPTFQLNLNTIAPEFALKTQKLAREPLAIFKKLI